MGVYWSDLEGKLQVFLLTEYSMKMKYMQAMSRRIHYGKFVAEVKFRESPHDYEPLIRSRVYFTMLSFLTIVLTRE